LDKIWVAYNSGAAAPSSNLRVLLWEVGPATDAEPGTLPSNAGAVTDLFSEQQIYSPGGAAITPATGFAIFDVEDVALSAGKRYAFTLDYASSSAIFNWRQSNDDSTGSFYLLGTKGFGGQTDRAYALQAVSGSNPARMSTIFQAADWTGESGIVISNVLVGAGGGDRSVLHTRFNTETFVVGHAFTLDRIWVPYKSAASGHTADLRVFLWEVGPSTDPEPGDWPEIPKTAGEVTNLFSEDQIYNMNGGSIDPTAGYAVFDVEDVALAAGKRYAFALDYGSSTALFSWPNSVNDPTGSYYELGYKNFGGQADRPYAIQAAPPSTTPGGTVIAVR
jgi:hypothetical protein